MERLTRSITCPKGTTAAAIFLLLSAWSSLVPALDIDLCSSYNTADTSRNTSIYQTNGLCHDFCVPQKLAYAITQGNSCWCSNYTPSKLKQVSLQSCTQACPGYPIEKCGGNGVFGYIALNLPPAGTKPASDSAPQPSSPAPSPKPAPPPSSSPPPPQAKTSTSTTRVTQTVQNTSTLSVTEASTATLMSSIVMTVTTGGTVKTVTVMPTSTGDESEKDSAVRVQKEGLSGATVAGIVVGMSVAVLAIAGAILLLHRRRKRRRQEEAEFRDDPSVRGSSSGMILGRPDMAAAPGSPGSIDNRSSMLQIDPRMDPFKQGLYAGSASHESLNSLRDDHDYSRRIQQPKVLRATNPDPTED